MIVTVRIEIDNAMQVFSAEHPTPSEVGLWIYECLHHCWIHADDNIFGFTPEAILIHALAHGERDLDGGVVDAAVQAAAHARTNLEQDDASVSSNET